MRSSIDTPSVICEHDDDSGWEWSVSAAKRRSIELGRPVYLLNALGYVWTSYEPIPVTTDPKMIKCDLSRVTVWRVVDGELIEDE